MLPTHYATLCAQRVPVHQVRAGEDGRVFSVSALVFQAAWEWSPCWKRRAMLAATAGAYIYILRMEMFRTVDVTNTPSKPLPAGTDGAASAGLGRW